MDGYSATRKLRKNDFTSPIIALSAHANREAFDAAFQAGMDDYLSKPIQMETLNSAMQRWLGTNALLKINKDVSGSKNKVADDFAMDNKSQIVESYPSDVGHPLGESFYQAEGSSIAEGSYQADGSPLAEGSNLTEDSYQAEGASRVYGDSLSQLSCVSLDEVLERLNNNTGLLKKLLEKYYDTYVNHFDLIQQAFDNHHYLDVSELAHKMKGASRSLGIDGVGEKAEQLEISLKEGILSEGVNYTQLLQQLKKEQSESMQELASFLQRNE